MQSVRRIIYIFSLMLVLIQFNSPLLNAANLGSSYIPILLYHRVTPKITSLYDITPEMLEEQLQFFHDYGYHPITALQYLNAQTKQEKLPSKPVILTFDDGNKDHYQNVYPILKKYGVKATFFVYPALVTEESEYWITWNELIEMSREGMDIESHTFSHPFLTATKTRLDDPRYLKWLDHELSDSKTMLEQKLKTSTPILAYPYGWYNCVVESKAFLAGYRAIYTVNWGVNLPDENPLRIRRRAVSNNLSLSELRKYLESKPLPLNIIYPQDGAVLNEKPEIRFKIPNSEIRWVDIIIGKDKSGLVADQDGVYSFSKFKLTNPGYQMIIVSGYDQNNQFYISSWGFDYQKNSFENDLNAPMEKIYQSEIK